MATIHVADVIECKVCGQTNALLYWKRTHPQDNTESEYNYYHTCKFCCVKKLVDENSELDAREVCKELDIPYIQPVWQKAHIATSKKRTEGKIPKYDMYREMTDDEKFKMSLISEYLKAAKLKANTHFFKGRTYVNDKVLTSKELEVGIKLLSVDETKSIAPSSSYAETVSAVKEELSQPTLANPSEENGVLDEYGQINVSRLSHKDKLFLYKKWGTNYTLEKLLWLEEMWIKMCESYDIITAAHEDYLLKICKISLAIEDATASDNWDLVLKLGKMYDTWMKSAQFAESSKKKDKIDESIPAICEVIKMVEEQGFIDKIDLDVPRDIVDLTYNNLCNYTRKLVLSETNLSALLEKAIEKIAESEEEGDIDDLRDEYDLAEPEDGENLEPIKKEKNFTLGSNNFLDYQDSFNVMTERNIGNNDFNPEKGFETLISGNEEEYNEV